MVLTALACNACCWLPPVLVAFGGASLGLAEFLHPYRPYLLAAMVLQLAWGFRNAYKTCDCCDHRHGTSRRLRIGMMWGVAVVVVGLNLIPDQDGASPATHVAHHPAHGAFLN